MNTKRLVVASAAISLLAAAGAAHATTVATLPVTLTGSGLGGSIMLTGSGSGLLDSNGTFAVGAVLTLVDAAVQETATIDVIDTFDGVLSPSGFSVTSGTTQIVSCTNAAVVCAAAPSSTISSASGFFNSSGGTLMTTVVNAGQGVTLNDTYQVGAGTFSPPPSAVPLPPAVWLFGSGLFGLLGAAGRRAP
jgi:hypothetical protein